MAQFCGTHSGLRVAWRRHLGSRTSCALALCAAVAALACAAGAARAGSSPPPASPQPQNLWHAYPLDAGPRSPSPPASNRVAESSSTGSRRSPVLLWVAIAAFVAAAVAFAVSWRRRGRRWPLASRLAAEHGFVLAAAGPRLFNGTVRRGEPVDAVVERAPAPSSPAASGDSAVERWTLERKRKEAPRSETIKLKEKKRRVSPERSRDDASVLRAKLVGSGQRSVAEAASVAAPARLRPVSAKRCHIAWWRGYVKSEFQAHSASPDGRSAVVATSPAFRWSKSEPPPADLAEAVKAHVALREELEAGGWVPAGKGKQWYALEFERPPLGGGRGRVEHEQ